MLHNPEGNGEEAAVMECAEATEAVAAEEEQS